MTIEALDLQWDLAVEADSATLAQQVKERVTPALMDQYLAKAFAAKTLPARILNHFQGAGLITTDWIPRLLATNERLDWGRAMEWREQAVGKDKADQEAKLAVEREMANFLDRRVQDPTKRREADAMILSLLSREEGMELHSKSFKSLMEAGHGYQIFRLASQELDHAWLANSGLDVLSVIHQAIASNDHEPLMEPVGGQDRDRIPRTHMDRWLDSHPAYRQTWEAWVAQDLDLAQCYDDWKQRWMPNRWKGSPLQQWCSNTAAIPGILEDVTGTPLDHPIMTEAAQWTKLPLSMAGMIKNAMEETLTEPPHATLLREINKFRGAKFNNTPDQPRTIQWPPLTTLGQGLGYRKSWVDDFVCTDAGAQMTQAAMDEDGRLKQAIGSWKIAKVVAWILKQPRWQTWRDAQGFNVLHVCCLHRAEKEAHATKAPLMKLAKRFPELLLELGPDGKRVVDRLNVTDNVRVDLERALLQHHVVEPQQRAKRPAARI